MRQVRQDPGDGWITADRLLERARRLDGISNACTDIAVVVGAVCWAAIVICFVGIFYAIYVMDPTQIEVLTISAAVNGAGMILAVGFKGVAIWLGLKADSLRHEASDMPANVAHRSMTLSW